MRVPQIFQVDPKDHHTCPLERKQGDIRHPQRRRRWEMEWRDVMPLQARNLAAPGSQQGKKPQSPSETQASRGGHSTLLWPPVFYHFFSAGAELLEETCRPEGL